jgi:hypothetical protein
MSTDPNSSLSIQIDNSLMDPFDSVTIFYTNQQILPNYTPIEKNLWILQANPSSKGYY